MKEDNEQLLDRFKQEVAQDYEDTQSQRDAANEDMRFCSVDGGMWEGWLENTHGSDSSRARLEFDITTDYVNRYVGEQTLNRANATFEAGDSATSEEDAEFLNGIYRADYSDNDGQVSQDTAIQEVAECGEGAFKIITGFEDTEDPENNNQDILFIPLYNAYNNVIWNSNAKRVDKSDATTCTVLTTYTKKAFEKEWPDAEAFNAYTPNTRADFNWVSPELIYVAERYEVKVEKVKVSVYQNLEQNRVESYITKDIDLIKDELKEEGWEHVRDRTLTRRNIYKSIFNGVEFLEEEKRIPGRFIPIIPMYGFRKFVDGVEYSRGLVRKLKDANRLLNANVSRMAESGATSGDSIPVFTEEEIEGKKGLWANKTNKAYMLKNPVEDPQGNLVKLPMEYLAPNQVDPNTIATTQMVTDYVQRTTGNAPNDVVDPDASGKAINALRKRENLNTQVMSDNIKTSIKHSAKVYQSIASEIYTNPRSKRSQAEDGKNSIVALQKMVMDKESGVMTPTNDLTKGKFKVKIEVGPAYESQREATLESLERIMESVGPESLYFQPMMSMWLQNITGTGLKPLKDFNRQIMLKSGMAKPETPEEEQMLASISQEPDAQEELTKAATEQQKAEARNLDAASNEKVASAQLKNAQTAKVISDIGTDRAKTQNDRAKLMFDRLDSRANNQ